MRALIWFGSTQSRRREASQFAMKASRPEIIVMIYFIKAEIPGKIQDDLDQPCANRSSADLWRIQTEPHMGPTFDRICRSSAGFGLMTPEGKDVMPS